MPAVLQSDSHMRSFAILVVTALLVGGCGSIVADNRPATPEMFAPASIRLHPNFTQVHDWTGDGRPDGIEALVEFTDRFGDPTKASGTVLFELFAYRPQHPDPRGARLVNPWSGSLATVAQQQAHWSGTTQTYNFRLGWDQIDPARTYVLTATFETSDGRRFFDRIVLTPTSRNRDGVSPTTQPSGS